MFILYLKKRSYRVLIIYLFAIIITVFKLNLSGTGYRPSITGGSGPLDWVEILGMMPDILTKGLIIVFVFGYMDYIAFRYKMNKNKKSQD